jgi:hypothetical protein
MSKYSRNMDQFEQKQHSFMIRIWLERDSLKNSRSEWRGWIDHVPSGKRRYFREFSEVSEFILACTSHPSNPSSIPDSE